LTLPERQGTLRGVNLEDIRRRLMDGFRPFIIRTSDGREFPVPHKEFIFLTRRSVVIADEEGYVDILDPLHISSLRELGDLPTRR
jgi:hypothetical protein